MSSKGIWHFFLTEFVLLGLEKSLRIKSCEILDPLKTPPGTPMRPKGGLVHSRDLNQYYRPQEILHTNFEEQFDVPLVAL